MKVWFEAHARARTLKAIIEGIWFLWIWTAIEFRELLRESW
jgi:hypothetical protein